MDEKELKRFLPKINKQNTTCWEWKAALNKWGYGIFYHHNKMRGAHRVSYEHFIGNIENDLCVLHKCDNPKCVNPNHLFLGTHQDNSDDKHQKKRGNNVKGEQHPNAKLTNENVAEIKASLKHRGDQARLARKFSVDKNVIHLIWKGIAWK